MKPMVAKIDSASTSISSRLLTKSASGVLAALRGSTYHREYASPHRLLRPCWTDFLNSLRWLLHEAVSLQSLRFCHAQVVCHHPARRLRGTDKDAGSVWGCLFTFE
jgi:hypothetical protein